MVADLTLTTINLHLVQKRNRSCYARKTHRSMLSGKGESRSVAA